MKRVALLVGLLAGLALLPSPAPSLASRHVAFDLDGFCGGYREGEYRWCTRVRQVNGRVKLQLDASPEMRGPYKVCVKPPHGRRECRRLTLHGFIYVATNRIDFAHHFPHRHSGLYRVRWFRGRALGPALLFHFPAPYRVCTPRVCSS